MWPAQWSSGLASTTSYFCMGHPHTLTQSANPRARGLKCSDNIFTWFFRKKVPTLAQDKLMGVIFSSRFHRCRSYRGVLGLDLVCESGDLVYSNPICVTFRLVQNSRSVKTWSFAMQLPPYPQIQIILSPLPIWNIQLNRVKVVFSNFHITHHLILQVLQWASFERVCIQISTVCHWLLWPVATNTLVENLQISHIAIAPDYLSGSVRSCPRQWYAMSTTNMVHLVHNILLMFGLHNVCLILHHWLCLICIRN